jgi:hypothetical protein
MPVSNSRCAYAWETNAANKVGYYYMSGTTLHGRAQSEFLISAAVDSDHESCKISARPPPAALLHICTTGSGAWLRLGSDEEQSEPDRLH